MPTKRTRPPSSSISKRRKIDGPSIKAPAVLASKGNTPTRPPCLMLLPGDREGQEQSATGCVLNLKDNAVHDLTNMGSVIGGDYSWVCVGSSHGWLMLFYGDKAEGHMFLLNPSFLTPNLSPPLFCFPSISGTAIKAILLSDPSTDEEFGAVAIYKHNTGLGHPNHTKIAFYKHGDDQWSDLGVAKGLIYCDIMCHNNHLYALTDCGSIEVWDLHGSDQPEKIRDIKPSTADKMIHTYQTRKDLYSNQLYLVESSGEILLVERYRGYYVDPEGRAVTEWDLLPEDDTQPSVYPYRTLFFHVYKLDSDGERWVEVHDLKHKALFVGGSHSMSLSTKNFPGCKTNAIYFSDDNWDQMDEDFLYGGHDFGVFDLKKRTKKPLDGFKYDRMVPPPVWVVPTNTR
ncbi:hypothetical protein Tsubulata_042144 [Turnera subulata]|uniref:KIB1-4 beta-propeller domain-containing protein n=1 Tax=Turnera subulata TaxID=218843 RepID=A0A9Q0J6F0_9ROSI|nr:hypothetical protein Tsubulata_042144 [Turnera subulata]